MKWSSNPINLPLAGNVAASGVLTLEFGPQYDQAWEVSQISIRMPTAPVGAICDVYYMSSHVSRAHSARYGTAAGDPPIYLQPGEKMRVVWTDATPNDPGNILVIYRRGIF